MKKQTKQFKAALSAVRSRTWTELGSQRMPMLRNAFRNQGALDKFDSADAGVVNGIDKSPETVRISIRISMSKTDKSYMLLQYLFDNDEATGRVDRRYFNDKLKAEFLPTESVTIKGNEDSVWIANLFAHAATEVAKQKSVLANKVHVVGPGVGNVPQLAHSSYAFAATTALLPPLTKWKKEKFSFGVRYTYGSGDGFFKIDQNLRNKKWVVNGSNIHELFPKLAKAFPYHEAVLRDGVLVNDRGDADEFATPAAARTALLKALKLALIRNTNAEARSRNTGVAVAVAVAATKKAKFDPNKTYSYYYRTVRLGFDEGMPQNRVDIWLCGHSDFDYDIAKKFKQRYEEARAENKKVGAFGAGLSYGSQGRDIKLSSIKGSFRHSHSGIGGGGPLFVLHDAAELRGAKLRKILTETVTRDTATADVRDASIAVAASYPTLKPLAKWNKEEDEDNIDGGLYYHLDSPGDGSFIIALDDTGWIVIHEFKTQQALARDPDGKFYASKTVDDNVKEIHFQTAQEAWYALNAIWKKLDVKNMERFSDALPTNKSRAITASSVTQHVAVAGDTLSDRVASIVYGDLKRIKSTIAAWKGKMPEADYKEFVEYQKGVAKFIAQTFVPKLSEAYKAKVKSV